VVIGGGVEGRSISGIPFRVAPAMLSDPPSTFRVGNQPQKEANRVSTEEHAEQSEYRSLSAAIGQAVVAGTAGGVAGAVTNQVISALTKPKDEPEPPKKS
jgi:hypothetical protein